MIRLKRNCFFISVTDTDDSNNRKYSDFIYELCYYVISEDEKLKKMIDLAQFKRHDMKNMENLKNSLRECLVKYDVFIVLLDCLDNSYNPNVWFEFGVIATYQKPIILIAMENTKIPFDVNDINIIKIKDAFVNTLNLPSISTMDSVRLREIVKNRELSTHIYDFSRTFKDLLNESLDGISPFSSWFDQYDIEDLGYYSIRDLFTRSGIIRLIQNPDVRAECIAGEKEAFEGLISEVSKAQESLRTTRFANQSIVSGKRKNREIHNEFMNALYKASRKVKRCDRIICNNHPLKWNDILNVLEHSNSNIRVFIRQSQYDIGFELVIVDEKIAFIHFYQIEINGDKDENGDTYKHEVEVINSTLKIRGEAVCKKLANIFDRLHHRDFDTNGQEPSRTLLGIPKKKVLNDEEKSRGVFQLQTNYEQDNTDVLALRAKNGEAIKMFINAFQNWDISNSDDKQNMAIGICLIDRVFEADLEQYISDKKMADKIRKEAEKYRQEIQKLQ